MKRREILNLSRTGGKGAKCNDGNAYMLASTIRFFVSVPKIRSCPFLYFPNGGSQYENTFKKTAPAAGHGFF